MQGEPQGKQMDHEFSLVSLYWGPNVYQLESGLAFASQAGEVGVDQKVRYTWDDHWGNPLNRFDGSTKWEKFRMVNWGPAILTNPPCPGPLVSSDA